MQSGHKIYLHASLGAPRAHHSLFVETNAQTGTGHLYHVTGNIQSGMVYAPRPELHPLASPEFQRRKLLGYVPESEYHRVDEICRSVEPPAKQFDGARPLVPRDRLRALSGVDC
ncbi:hypothetical protein N656DRAFT_778117 [Canariomyces notabilis]|uniref:Uncharacterized protein n=1 Tax=Canariomyces notabilis TaxID=2074819 RepID=A0AAN6YUB0_9PEZI|nr:hypothetical protein N656DRAFT_778117 [Canariomyces arenarius]